MTPATGFAAISTELFLHLCSRAHGKATWSAMTGPYLGANNGHEATTGFIKHFRPTTDRWVQCILTFPMAARAKYKLGLIPNGLDDLELSQLWQLGRSYEFYTPRSTPKPAGSYHYKNPTFLDQCRRQFSPYIPPEVGREVKPDTTKYRTTTSPYGDGRTFQNDFAARMDWCIKPFSEITMLRGRLEYST